MFADSTYARDQATDAERIAMQYVTGASRFRLPVCFVSFACFAFPVCRVKQTRERGKLKDAFGKFTFGKVPSGEVRGKRGRWRGRLCRVAPKGTSSDTTRSGRGKGRPNAATHCQSARMPKDAECNLSIFLHHASERQPQVASSGSLLSR